MRFLSLMPGVFRRGSSTNSLAFDLKRGNISPSFHNQVIRGIKTFEAFDWHERGVISSVVHNQRSESTCTSFAVLEAVQAAHFLARGEVVLLSTRDLSRNVGVPYTRYRRQVLGGNCLMEDAFSFIEHNGVLLEKDCPYGNIEIMKPGIEGVNIERVGRRVFIDMYETCTDEKSILRALKTQPVVADLLVDESFDAYKEGIYCRNPKMKHCTIGHCVTIVGCGVCPATGVEFWTIKNTYGYIWGKGGFGRILKESPDTLILASGYPIIFKECVGDDKDGERDYSRDRLSFLRSCD